VIERKSETTEGAEDVGFSHGDLGFIIQTLDNSTGKQLLSAEIVVRISSRCWRSDRAIFFFIGSMRGCGRGGLPDALPPVM
jgi:hypothetical protein